MGTFLGTGALWEGGMKTRLPENGASMSEGGGGHTEGLGPRKLGSPRGQMGRGSCKRRVGSAQLGDWRPACGSPHPGQGGTWEGQPQAVGVPTSQA